MKRLIIAGILLALCVGLSAYAAHFVGEVTDRVHHSVEGALTAIADQDDDALKTHVGELQDYWNQKEDYLIHLVRHGQIDSITRDVSRLGALAAGKEYAELAAELESILWQINHICRSERMIFSNLL